MCACDFNYVCSLHRTLWITELRNELGIEDEPSIHDVRDSLLASEPISREEYDRG